MLFYDIFGFNFTFIEIKIKTVTENLRILTTNSTLKSNIEVLVIKINKN